MFGFICVLSHSDYFQSLLREHADARMAQTQHKSSFCPSIAKTIVDDETFYRIICITSLTLGVISKANNIYIMSFSINNHYHILENKGQ